MPRIIAESSEIDAVTFELGESAISVGRAPDNGVHIPHASVSGHHAEMTYVDGDYQIVDLNSTNGTRINDERINEGILRNGDILQLGNILFRYESENILEAPPLPDVDSVLANAGAKGRPASFVNFSPIPKKKKADGSPTIVLVSVGVLALGGAGYFAYAVMTALENLG